MKWFHLAVAVGTLLAGLVWAMLLVYGITTHQAGARVLLVGAFMVALMSWSGIHSFRRYAAAKPKVANRRTTAGLTFGIAIVWWFLLMTVWISSPPGGIADKFIGGLFNPAYGVGHSIGAWFFPDYRVRYSTGSYWVPLFGAATTLLLLMVASYVGIRIARAFGGRGGNEASSLAHRELSSQ